MAHVHDISCVGDVDMALHPGLGSARGQHDQLEIYIRHLRRELHYRRAERRVLAIVLCRDQLKLHLLLKFIRALSIV